MMQALLAGLLFSGCQEQAPNSTDIPFDPIKAQKHIISVKEGAKLTATYRRGKLALIKQLRDSDYLKRSFSIPDAEMFNRDAIAVLLNQKGASGMRIYMGEDEKGLIKLVLVAVDNKGNDITNSVAETKRMAFSSTQTSAIVVEAGQRCPTMCSLTGPIKE